MWKQMQFDKNGRTEMKIALHLLHFSIYCTLPHNIYPSRELFIPSYTWSQSLKAGTVTIEYWEPHYLALKFITSSSYTINKLLMQVMYSNHHNKSTFFLYTRVLSIKIIHNSGSQLWLKAIEFIEIHSIFSRTQVTIFRLAFD